MTDTRAAFETWYSGDGKYPKAIRRDDDGDGYHLMHAQSSWAAWEAAIKHERSECAKVCEDMAGTMSMFANVKDAKMHNNAIAGCAAAIRARSQPLTNTEPFGTVPITEVAEQGSKRS
jgi:hypothetical protein